MSVSLVLVYQWKWCSQDIHWGSYQQRITWQEKKNKLNFNWRHRLRYGGYCPRIFFLKGRPSTSPVCFSDYLSVWLLPSTLVRSSNIIEARQSLAGVVFGISSLWTPSKSGRPACPLVSRCRCFGGGGPKLGATWPNMNSITTEKNSQRTWTWLSCLTGSGNPHWCVYSVAGSIPGFRVAFSPSSIRLEKCEWCVRSQRKVWTAWPGCQCYTAIRLSPALWLS